VRTPSTLPGKAQVRVKNSIRTGGVALILILEACDEAGVQQSELHDHSPASEPAGLGFRVDSEDPAIPLSLGGPAGAANLVFSGLAASDYAGASLSDVGDFDGDGHPDFLVGAYGAGNGTAYLVRGGPWLASLTGPVDLDAQSNSNITGIFGESTSDQAGRSVSAAGDVNGDGLADLIVGASRSDAGASNAGSAYIIFGTPNPGWHRYLSGVRSGAYPAIALDGQVSSDYAGHSVSAAGDFNGDGFGDVVIGAYGADRPGSLPFSTVSNVGKAYVVFGQPTWVGTGHSAQSLAGLVASGGAAEIVGEHAGGYLGYSVAGAGDFNGDGLDDVVVGANRAPGGSGVSQSGRAYIVYGRTSGFSIDVGAKEVWVSEVVGSAASDYLGYSIDGGGDFNRDGFDDVVIGAPLVDTPAGANTGAGYVVFGSAASKMGSVTNLLSLGRAVEFQGVGAGDLLGYSVAMGADFNGDGLGDVLFGAAGADPGGLTGAGTAYMAYGADDPAISSQPVLAVDLAAEVGGLSFDGEAAGDAAGRSVDFVRPISMGSDLLVAVGAYRADRDGSTPNSGKAYAIRPDPLPGQYYALNRAPDTAPDIYYGEQGAAVSVSAAGVLDNDIDHDGDTLSVQPGQEVTGAGCTVDLFADGSFTASPPSALWWGVCHAVYTAQDGIGGARDEDLFVVYPLSDLSVADLVLAEAGIIWNGEAVADGAGQSLDVVPDVDDDGLDEILVGAYGHDTAGLWSGRAYLVYGQDTAAELELGSVVAGVDGAVIDGEAAFDWLGLEVAFGGINSMGEPELLVGAIGYDGVGERSGRLYRVEASDLAASSPGVAGQTGLAYEGEFDLDDAGRSAGSAGDFNGDGFPDIHISSYRADSSMLDAEDVGVVYVVYGAPGALGSGSVDLADVGVAVPGVRIEGVSHGDLAGFSVSTIGDLNGDGRDELAIGAYAADTDLGGTASGRVYIVYGSSTLTTVDLRDLEDNVGNLGVVLDGGQPFELAGRVVAGLGDINDDGIDDLLIGAPGADDGTGCAYVVFGAASLGGASALVNLPDLIADEAGMILHGTQVGDGLGSNGARLGDFDADGVADFAVSAPYADGDTAPGTGRVYVVFGGDDLTAEYIPAADVAGAGYGFTVTGAESGDAFGHAVAGGGDVNGDGFADLVVGAYEASPPSGEQAGRAYVVFGHPQAAGLLEGAL